MVWVDIHLGGAEYILSSRIEDGDCIGSVHLDGVISDVNGSPGGLEFDGVGAGVEGVEVEETVTKLISE